jgi:2-polyprenyl-3-methyl-5-hydroxy-6-metoxy-1,4-benzoquinol methylase
MLSGVDRSEEAVSVARQRIAGRNISFSTGNAAALNYPDDSFDIALLRGIVHHALHPRAVICEALRVARVVFVIEPNGYNPAVKVLEKVSRYHRSHGEKSFSPAQLKCWAEQSGGQVQSRTFAGLVPFFCHDYVAKLLKRAEPAIERHHPFNMFFCAVCAMLITRRPGDARP